MKKIKLLLSTCFLAVLSLFGIAGSVSAAEVTTTTEAPATTTEAKDKVTSYVRYASIYEGVDKDKAKQIANQALQFVDDRFTYYPNIIAVLEG